MEQFYQETLQQLRAVWRRRWWILPVAWLICLLGWAYIYTLPDSYQASSRVFVNSQTVLDPLLRGMTVRPDTEQRMRIMSTTLLSDDNLAQIARQADLDILLGGEDSAELTRLLRSGIEFRSGNRDNIYSISYSHNNPEVAYRVVRETANLFMERGLGDSRIDLLSSREFIERQLERYEAQLRDKEREIEQFKRDNAAHLSSGGDYYARLERAREQLNQAQLERDEAVQRVETLLGRLRGGGAEFANPQLDERINRLEGQLDELRRAYTERHPDVVQTRRILAELLEQRSQEASEFAVGGVPMAGTDSPFQLALAEAESRAASLETRVREHRRRVDALESAVDRVPAVESEYTALTRNYDVLRQNHRELLATRERAVITGSVETETDAVDFRVLEPPRLPTSPAAPDRPVLASAILLLGLAAGSGFAFLLAQLRGTVSSTAQLAELAGRPVLGTVSRVSTPERLQRRRAELVVFFAATAALLGFYGVVLAVFLTV